MTVADIKRRSAVPDHAQPAALGLTVVIKVNIKRLRKSLKEGHGHAVNRQIEIEDGQGHQIEGKNSTLQAVH